ncbi:protein ABHD11-like isoform X1 [Teleopsis dalmanni]|uniref:protein ABHD11-like isoform X1 n=1 Tax=Teleopsis dalmanni TaxID=139649 RepID=UPI0018CFB1DF|nr:protein ABHD11-like isoform X1 [Teleopsis dalmanni]
MFSVRLLSTRPSKKCVRSFKSDSKPIKMAYILYEGPNTDKTLPPLIVMHGLFGSKQNWRRICRELQPKIKQRIYSVDARNHGQSPHTNEHSSASMAEDVAEFIRQQGYAKVSLMGYCMGGKTLMYFAILHPDLIERSIFVDVSPFSVRRPEIKSIMLTMKNISISKDLSMPEARKIVNDKLRTVSNSNIITFISLNLRKRRTGEFYWLFNIDPIFNSTQQVSEFVEYADKMKPFVKPTIFICGKRSSYMDPKSWPDIQKLFPNSKLYWLDAGHVVHLEQPEEFLKIVTKFLSK